MQYRLDFAPRPMLRLAMVEQIIRSNRLLVPPPSRPNLIALIEEGRIEGKLTEYGWIMFEDSFIAWIKDLQGGVPSQSQPVRRHADSGRSKVRP
jgi:hypothetical protein